MDIELASLCEGAGLVCGQPGLLTPSGDPFEPMTTSLIRAPDPNGSRAGAPRQVSIVPRARRHFAPLGYGSLHEQPADPQPSSGLVFNRRATICLSLSDTVMPAPTFSCYR